MDLPHLSKKEYLILDLLRDGVERYGLEMVQLANGTLKRGTIYVTLSRMIEKGYIRSRQEVIENKPGLPRRLYQISAKGAQALRATETAAAVFGGAGYA